MLRILPFFFQGGLRAETPNTNVGCQTAFAEENGMYTGEFHTFAHLVEHRDQGIKSLYLYDWSDRNVRPNDYRISASRAVKPSTASKTTKLYPTLLLGFRALSSASLPFSGFSAFKIDRSANLLLVLMDQKMCIPPNTELNVLISIVKFSAAFTPSTHHKLWQFIFLDSGPFSRNGGP